MTDHESDRMVVAVDGSASSDAAIRWAAAEAAMRNIDLTLLHVAVPGVSVWGLGYAMAPLPMDYGKLEEEQGQHVLAAARQTVKEAIPAGGHVEVHSELVLASPVPTLLDATKDAHLMVVGCRGRGAWQRGLFGSVSTALVHHASCPVAVIPDPADATLHTDGPVVVGVDGSPASDRAVAIAFDEASWRGAELVAIHAWLDSDVSSLPTSAWPDFQPTAEKTLAERLAGWSDRYPDVVVRRQAVFNRPARHLVEASESAQLVVVGSHGRGGFAGMLLGSVSTTVLHSVHTPVIVARQA